jgi:hypothetical protein
MDPCVDSWKLAIQAWAPARADDDTFWMVSGLVAPEIWPAFAVLSDLVAESILQLTKLSL